VTQHGRAQLAPQTGLRRRDRPSLTAAESGRSA